MLYKSPHTLQLPLQKSTCSYCPYTLQLFFHNCYDISSFTYEEQFYTDFLRKCLVTIVVVCKGLNE